MSLRRSMAKGAVWMTLLRLSDRTIGIVSTMFLARLLVPEDFGLIAMAMSLIAGIEILSAFSFDLSLIRLRNAERAHYDTAWTLNILASLTNAMVLLLLASPAAVFFAEPRVESIVRWLALYVAIQGFANIGVVAFQKELQFHREFILGMTKRVVSFCVTVSLAFMLRTYWALVVGMIISAGLGVLLSYGMHSYRPRLCFSARTELFLFSKWMLLNNVLIFLIHRTTDLVVGRVSGPQALGTYSVAYEISNLPTTELVFPITRAVFPGYSKMSHDLSEIRRGFVDVLSVILLFVLPAGLGVVAVAEPLINVVLGSQWTAAIPLVKILGVFGVLRAATSNTGAVYMALGLPRIITYLSVLYLVLLGGALFVLVPRHGAIGAACSVLFAASIQIPIGFIVLGRIIDMSLDTFMGCVWRPLVSALVMVGVVSATLSWLASQGYESLLQLAIAVPLGAASYGGSVLGLWVLSRRPQGGEAVLLPYLRAFSGRLGAVLSPGR